MTVGLNAAQARAKSTQDMIVFEECTAIMRAIITDSTAGLYDSYIEDSTTMTNSNPETLDSKKYFSVWKGVETDRALQNQMNQVIKHFDNLGYKIERITNTNTGNTFKWHIYW